jgi:hypothetical protein
MEKNDLFLNPEPKIDTRTDYSKGLKQKIDTRTDFGKGITFKTCDGKDVATMEEVMQYNQMFFERMMNKTEKKRMHR